MGGRRRPSTSISADNARKGPVSSDGCLKIPDRVCPVQCLVFRNSLSSVIQDMLLEGFFSPASAQPRIARLRQGNRRDAKPLKGAAMTLLHELLPAIEWSGYSPSPFEQRQEEYLRRT